MKIVHLLLIVTVVCAFNACEKQPYSKTENIINTENAGTEHEAKTPEKAEKPEPAK